MALFTFGDSLNKDDATQAILDQEMAAWTKAQAATTQATSPAFNTARPTLEDVQTQYAGDSPSAALMRYATGTPNIPADGDKPLTEAQAKKLGAVLLQLEKNNEAKGEKHPEFSARGSDGKDYALEPKELSAWLQASGKSGANIPVDKWVKDNNVSLTGEGYDIKNGAEDIYIETAAGQRRIVGNGNLAEPMGGYYGGIAGVTVGDGDLLDVYISKDVYADMQQGQAYTGPVFVMQQMDKGRNDELKLGFAKDVNEFQAMQTSSWKNPNDFKQLNEGKYVELSQEQFGALKSALKQKPDLSLEDFAKGAGLQIEQIERTPGAVEAPATQAKEQQAEKPLSSLSGDILKAALGAVDKMAIQFHEVAHASQGNKPTPLVANDVQRGDGHALT